TADGEADTPPAPASDGPLVDWWCLCYYKVGADDPEPLTACRSSQAECAKLEKAVMAGKSGIIYASVTHPCQESKAAHPGDVHGGRDVWQPSKKAGSWLSAGACRLPGPGKEVDLSARPAEAEGLLSAERFGDLRYGLPAADVTAKLGEPASRGKNQLWEADGAYHQDWSYPAIGVTLDMASDSRSGPKKVASITLRAPATLATSKGVTVGSPRALVLDRYGKLRDPESPAEDDTFVAGSIFGGVIFAFEGGKVSQIFLGAGAE
ncbi:MAG TPA: hypothetical protein PKW35_21835, partial [Nannocystaceae bacterium]|nr:hypothetical protein [Nannocystaceae bacterium]